MREFDKEYLVKRCGVHNRLLQEYYYLLGKIYPQKLANIFFKKQFNRSINWKNPKDLNEKINWLAFKTDTSLWTTLSDKITVRDYVVSKGFEYILPKLYAVWENPQFIDFDILPKKFVVKYNHDSGSVFLIDDKSKVSKEDLVNAIKKKSHSFGIITAEPHYKRIEKKVFAEEYIENNNIGFSLIDYEFWSFNGKVEYCHVYYKKNINERKKQKIFKISDWSCQKHKVTENQENIEIPPPEKLTEMLYIISILTKNFPQCRVGLYESNAKIYFGEFTFTSCCGRICDYTNDFLLELGSKINLPKT
jgi:hypothetical protein